jgi:hypothetical protein
MGADNYLINELGAGCSCPMSAARPATARPS